MNSLRTRLTLAFGTLLVLILGCAFLLINRQIRVAYEEQVADTTEQMRLWTERLYRQVGDELQPPIEQLRADVKILGDVQAEKAGTRPDTPLDIVEYGTLSGRILYSDWNVREGNTSEYINKKMPTLILWQGRLALLQTLPIQSGSVPFGFVTGGYWLYQYLAKSVPPGGALLFLQEGLDKVSVLSGQKILAPEQIALLNSAQVEFEETVYRLTRLPLEGGLGKIIVAIPRTRVDVQRGQLRTLLLFLSLFSGLATFGASYLVARTLTRPLEQLYEGAQHLADGNLSVQLDVHSQDEIGMLTRQFNKMVVRLQTMQHKLLHAERVATWQDMARMMAHEIKNPLFPIQLSVENLQRCYQRRPDMLGEILEESTQTVLEEVSKLRRIVDEFREFARLPSPILSPCQVNKVVEQSLRLYATLPASTTIRSELTPSLPQVEADPEQLGQVCQNLIKNALEAMPNGGELVVHTFSVDQNMVNSPLPDAPKRPTAKQEGQVQRWVCVEFRDTGVGMSQEVRKNLFRPYFTTKEGGTGLGMAVVERIIREHDGHLTVASEPGQGTSITVYLPQ